MFTIEKIVKEWHDISKVLNDLHANEHDKAQRTIIEQVGNAILETLKNNREFVLRQFNMYASATIQEGFYDDIEPNKNAYYICISAANGAVNLLTYSVNRFMKKLYGREVTFSDIQIIDKVFDGVYCDYINNANDAYKAACV